MNLKIWKLRLPALLLFAFATLLTVSVTEANAQKTPRTKTGKIRPNVPPTPPVSAEVISRDADYATQNQIIEPVEAAASETETTPTSAENTDALIKELKQRIATLEAGNRTTYDEKQKRLLLNLDILTRAEQRAETLRKQLFEMIEKENQISLKLDQITSDIRPEIIERQVAFAGSLRPEELRDMRRKNLEVERRNLQTLLSDIKTVRANLDVNVQKADQLVEKLRVKLEGEIDAALEEKTDN